MNLQDTTGDLTSPSLNLFADPSQSILIKQNDKNFIYALTVQQLPVLQNLGLLDIYLSHGHIIEPHWHPNAAELNYVVSGEVIVSILNPFTNQLLTYHIKAPQTVYIPMGWWHWQIGATDDTHFIAVFDSNAPQVVFGSDVLMKTPTQVLQLAYGINGEQLSQVLKPITGTVGIGPPNQRNAKREDENYSNYSSNAIKWSIGNNQGLQ